MFTARLCRIPCGKPMAYRSRPFTIEATPPRDAILAAAQPQSFTNAR